MQFKLQCLYFFGNIAASMSNISVWIILYSGMNEKKIFWRRVLFSNNSFYSTCILQVIPGQFKHPQVHVGDGVEGAAGQ